MKIRGRGTKDTPRRTEQRAIYAKKRRRPNGEGGVPEKKRGSGEK